MPGCSTRSYPAPLPHPIQAWDAKSPLSIAAAVIYIITALAKVGGWNAEPRRARVTRQSWLAGLDGSAGIAAAGLVLASRCHNS